MACHLHYSHHFISTGLNSNELIKKPVSTSVQRQMLIKRKIEKCQTLILLTFSFGIFCSVSSFPKVRNLIFLIFLMIRVNISSFFQLQKV